MILKGLNGKMYPLENSPIGSGGEGDIYVVSDNSKYVVKVYRKSVISQSLEEKLRIMVRRPPSMSVLNQVAWPLDVVYDSKGVFCGFVMPKLDITHELSEVYVYPQKIEITYKQKLILAQNICAVIHEVHKAGYIFGDFNPRNIGVNLSTGAIAFLDTDSYHIVIDKTASKAFRCNVCAPGYAAPELLKKCTEYISSHPEDKKQAYAKTPLDTFTIETDNFALAIHMFRLLMNGYTPFNGIPETQSASLSSPGQGDIAVLRNSYCFKKGNKPQAVAVPEFESLPKSIRSNFTRAFIDGRNNPSMRPSAIEWHKALENFEKQLVTCKVNSTHMYRKKLKKCPWCEADNRYLALMAPHPQTAKKARNRLDNKQQLIWSVSNPSNGREAIKRGVSLTLIILLLALAVSLIYIYTTKKMISSTENIASGDENETTINSQNRHEPYESNGYIILGAYEQDGDLDNGSEPIEWEILEEDDDSLFIVSRYVLDLQQYNIENTNVTWETCSLRRWLNGDFYIDAFSDDEKEWILATELSNPDNLEYEVSGGNNTSDKVFILSLEEVRTHYRFNSWEGLVFGGFSQNLTVEVTPMVHNKGKGQLVYDDLTEEEYGWLVDDENWLVDGHKGYSQSCFGRCCGKWWLRTPGGGQNRCCIVWPTGEVTYDKDAYVVSTSGIRPAMHIAKDFMTENITSGQEDQKSVALYEENGYIIFGSYEQDGDYSNGNEPIEWEILEDNEEGMLLASRYILELKPYNEEYTDVTWENCSLRTWLNDTFYNEAFSIGEQEWICEMELVNSDNKRYGVSGGNNTIDKVFLLSFDDVCKYYSFNSWDDVLLCGYSQNLTTEVSPLVYYEGKGSVCIDEFSKENYGWLMEEEGYKENESHCFGRNCGVWWLRTPGSGQRNCCYVWLTGEMSCGLDTGVDAYYVGVRPAIRIKKSVSSDILQNNRSD